jgi:23S rRNA pseudouridine2605 synthase
MTPKRPADGRGGNAAGSVRERIQKVLAARGVGSRRQVEAWIDAGRITVNGKPATPGQAVNARDDVRLDGRRLRLGRAEEAPHRGLAYHRPTQEGLRAGSEEGPGALEKLPGAGGHRWVPVSPLPPRDAGLELFVTDGALAAALTRRSYAVASAFSIRVRGNVDEPALVERLQGALEAVGARGRVESAGAGGGDGSNRWIQVETMGLRTGDLREAFAAVGLEPNRILRTRYGPVSMDRVLARGRTRPLTDSELSALQDLAGPKSAGSRSPRR